MQIASKEQRPRADKIAAALRGIGFTVPAYEVVGDRAPRKNQLRYYKSLDDADSSSKSSLDETLRKIKEADGVNWSIVPLQPSSSVRPGHFEIWFAGDPPPTPDSDEEVTLRLSYQDEQGNELSFSEPRVSLDDIPYTRARIVRSSTVRLPPGEYILHVQVHGYEIYRAELTVPARGLAHVVKLKPGRTAR
jgi:hypothetical protein